MSQDATGTSTETGPATVSEAASVLEGLFGDDYDDPIEEENEGDSGEEDVNPDPEADEAEADEANADEANADEEEEAEAEAEAEAEDEESESDDDFSEFDGTQEIPVRIDGKVERVSLDELKRGYSRTKVFTQRTTEAAERRKSADAMVAAIEQERTQLASLAQELEAKMSGGEDEPDWKTLEAEDPLEWAIQKQKWQDRQSGRDKVRVVREELERRNAAQATQRHQELLIGEQAALLDKIPEWKDTERAKKDIGAIRSFMVKDLGFSDEDAAQVYDHRAVVALRDAMRYRALMAKQATLKKGAPSAAKNAGAGKKAPKTLRPGAGVKPSNTSDRKAALDRVRKSGRTDDAAAAILKLGLID